MIVLGDFNTVLRADPPFVGSEDPRRFPIVHTDSHILQQILIALNNIPTYFCSWYTRTQNRLHIDSTTTGSVSPHAAVHEYAFRKELWHQWTSPSSIAGDTSEMACPSDGSLSSKSD